MYHPELKFANVFFVIFKLVCNTENERYNSIIPTFKRLGRRRETNFSTSFHRNFLSFCNELVKFKHF